MKQIDNIAHITHEMFAAAQTERWPIFYELEHKRHQMIHEFFTHIKESKTKHEIADIFNSILEVDKKIIALLEHGMHEIFMKSREITLGHRAVLAYLDQKV